MPRLHATASLSSFDLEYSQPDTERAQIAGPFAYGASITCGLASASIADFMPPPPAAIHPAYLNDYHLAAYRREGAIPPILDFSIFTTSPPAWASASSADSGSSPAATASPIDAASPADFKALVATIARPTAGSAFDVAVSRVIILTPVLMSTSYGNEHRFIAPAPQIRLVGLCGPAGERPSVRVKLDAYDHLEATTVSWARADGTPLDADEPLPPEARGLVTADSVWMPKGFADAERIDSVRVLVQLTQAGQDGVVELAGPAIRVVSKPTETKSAGTEPHSCIRHGSTVAIFNRVSTRSRKARFLSTSSAGHALPGFGVATDGHDDVSIWLADGGRPKHVPEGTPLAYDTPIVLYSAATQSFSQPLLIRKCPTDGAPSRDQPISQLRTITLERVAVGGSDGDGAFLAIDEDPVGLTFAHAPALVDKKAAKAFRAHSLWRIVNTLQTEYSAPFAAAPAGAWDEVWRGSPDNETGQKSGRSAGAESHNNDVHARAGPAQRGSKRKAEDGADGASKRARTEEASEAGQDRKGKRRAKGERPGDD
ncbi:hypothetical protein Q5752_003996 [Cryptotrichosporon argae]